MKLDTYIIHIYIYIYIKYIHIYYIENKNELKKDIYQHENT